MPFNPLADIEEKIEAKVEAAEARLFLAVQIALLRETAKTTLSRLATLDTAKSADYLSAIQTMDA